MTLTEIAAYSCIVLFAAYPVIASSLSKLATSWNRVETADAWQTRWVAQLITLQADLEKRKDAGGVRLTRELIWQILGGEQR